MAQTLFLRGISLVLLAAGSVVANDATAKSGVTPIQKVLDLMSDLLKQCISEKEEEAVKFSTFNQWCVDQTKVKKGEISDSKDAIEKQTAQIEKAEVTISKLSARIQELEEDVGRWEADKKAASDVRGKEASDYKATVTDYMESIDAITGAISVLKKQAFDRSQADLVQTSLLQVTRSRFVPASSKAIFKSFLQQPSVEAMPDDKLSYEAPEANAYEFQSGGVVDMLEKLKADFSTKKAELEKEELKTQHAYEAMMQQLADNIELASNEISKKSQERGATAKLKAETEADKAATTAELQADQKYLDDMTALCSVKSSDFEARSALRAQEIETVKKAIEIVSSEAVEAGSAHLPSLLARSSTPSNAALAQLRGDMQSPQLRAKVAAFLAARASNSGSRLLSNLAQQVQANPFTKVKKMIKELIWKLMEESTAEMENKGYCDTEVSTNKMTRERKTAEVAELSSNIEELEATIAELEQSIADLAADIKELTSAMAETTATRIKDKKANEKTIAEANAAQKAIQAAMAVLKDFYAKSAQATAFSQQSPAEDAPETFDKPYKGALPEGGNIVDFLEVILTDFTRLESETATEESQEADEYKKYMKDSEMDKALKENDKSHKEDKKSDKEGELQATKDELKTTQKQLDAAMTYYEKLKPACIDSGITYEERVKRREEEMQSLQEALKILQGQDIA